MTTFTNLDIEVSAEEIADQIVQDIQVKWPAWEPADANLETWLVDAFARIAAEVATLGSQTTLAIFQSFGQKIMNIPPQLAQPATVTSTWTAVDNAGYTIKAGDEVVIERTGDERYVFEVVGDVVIAPGSTATTAGQVALRAVIAGDEPNGILSSASVDLLTARTFVKAIVLTAAVGGGVEEETEGEYIVRLVEELTLMTPRPILPRDFAVLAKRNPAVFRAVAIDGWDVVGNTLGNERTVGLCVVDEAGNNLPIATRNAVAADLDARREINFVVGVGNPVYTDIFVTATVRAYPGLVTADVDAAVTAAITNYLSPANWGVTPFSDSPDTWANMTVVRRDELVTVANNVGGVDYVESLFLGTATAPAGTADINLSGRVPLTRPATTGTAITVTVNPG